jgi:hypothetical protein
MEKEIFASFVRRREGSFAMRVENDFFDAIRNVRRRAAFNAGRVRDNRRDNIPQKRIPVFIGSCLGQLGQKIAPDEAGASVDGHAVYIALPKKTHNKLRRKGLNFGHYNRKRPFLVPD